MLPSQLAERVRSTATIVHAKSGRTLVALGDNSSQVYFVLQGRLQTNLVSMNGKEVILRDLDVGGFFGELAAIDGQPRSASVVALTDCVLASIPGDAFRQAVTEIPEASAWLARRLVGQVRDLTERVFELNALRVRSRLHCELLRMCGTAPEASAVIEPAPTHAELASRIGTHREAITREIGFLIEQGIVEQQRRRMKVCDVPALARLVRAVVGHAEGEIVC